MDDGNAAAHKGGITVDVVEVVLLVVLVIGMACAIALPGGFSILSFDIGRYDVIFLSATALVAYRAVMRITT
jgi:hypothetical protein